MIRTVFNKLYQMPTKKKGKTTGSDHRIFLFTGTDTAKVKEGALKLSRKLAPKDDEFGLEIINGSAENSDHAGRILAQTSEAIQTIPFFGGGKVVWLQGANFFGDNIIGKANSTLKSIDSFLELLKGGVPEDVKLIINTTEMDKRRSFYKQIGKIALVESHDKVDISREGWQASVVSWVSGEASKKGMNFGPGAMERLVMTAGAETAVLASELEKLSLYFGDSEITEDRISQMVTPTHAGVIFEIGDAISKRDLPKSLDLVAKQLRNGEHPIGILRAAIIPKIRGLLHAKDLVARHHLRVGRNYKAFEAEVAGLPESDTAHLPRKKDGKISAYPIFQSARYASNFTLDELVNSLESCLEADLRLVTTQLDHRLVLDQLVTRILAGK